jgi:hypothetical protein
MQLEFFPIHTKEVWFDCRLSSCHMCHNQTYWNYYHGPLHIPKQHTQSCMSQQDEVSGCPAQKIITGVFHKHNRQIKNWL